MSDIPFVETSELGSKDKQEAIELLNTLVEDGRAVPRVWLLEKLGGIKAESLPSKLARYGFKSKTRDMVDGEKAVFILTK